MDVHPDAVMPPPRTAPQQRLDPALSRDSDAAQLRARLLKMIIENEKLRKGSGDSSRPR
jgi:hypothetical protein